MFEASKPIVPWACLQQHHPPACCRSLRCAGTAECAAVWGTGPTEKLPSRSDAIAPECETSALGFVRGGSVGFWTQATLRIQLRLYSIYPSSLLAAAFLGWAGLYLCIYYLLIIYLFITRISLTGRWCYISIWRCFFFSFPFSMTLVFIRNTDCRQ